MAEKSSANRDAGLQFGWRETADKRQTPRGWSTGLGGPCAVAFARVGAVQYARRSAPVTEVGVPKATRVRTTMTDAWVAPRLRLPCPERHVHERVRSVVVFGLTPVERLAQTGAAARAIARHVDLFEATGCARLLG